MRFAIFLLSAVFVFIVSGRSDLNAGQTFSHCEGTQSTADSMACVKKRHDEAQERLNKVFQDILHQQEKESGQAFQLTQNEWISYRDKECHWEIAQVANESLRRIEELSCLTALTEQRVHILEESYAQQQAKNIKEYGALPRWMNVVAKAHPEIFWRYGDYVSLDLDCDGQAEEIMLGQKLQSLDVHLEGSSPYDIQTVLAVVNNPVSGKPHFKLLPLNMAASEDNGPVCDLNPALHIIDYSKVVAVEETPSQESAAHCVHALEIRADGCQPLRAFWSQGYYVISPVASLP